MDKNEEKTKKVKSWMLLAVSGFSRGAVSAAHGKGREDRIGFCPRVSGFCFFVGLLQRLQFPALPEALLWDKQRGPSVRSRMSAAGASCAQGIEIFKLLMIWYKYKYILDGGRVWVNLAPACFS